MELEELVHPMQHHFPAVDFTTTPSFDYNSVEQKGSATAAPGFVSLSSWQSELGDVCSQNSCSYSFGQEQDVNSFSMFHHQHQQQQQHDSLSSTADNLDEQLFEPHLYEHEHLLAMVLPQQQQLRGYPSSSSAAAGIHRSDVLPAVDRDALQWHMLQYQSMPALLQLDIPSSGKTELLEDITAAATTSEESSLTEYPCSKRPRSAGCFTLEAVSQSVRRHASAGEALQHHQAIVRQLNAACTATAATATATPSPGRMSLKYPSKKQEGSVEPQSVAARQRRKRISERVRELEKLVPGGGKMDTATMLDEAFKFVKFLQIQVQLLESSSTAAGPNLAAYRKMPFPLYEYSGRTPPSPSPLVLTETLQHVLFKHRRCIASIQQCSRGA